METLDLIYISAHTDPGSNADAKKFQHIYNSGVYYEEFVPYPRSGTGPNPWNVKPMPVHIIPWLTTPYNYTFEETTDLRAQELLLNLKKNNLPIVFFWSGGIDSTVALCGMIRNFDSETMNRVVIKLNKSSYFENPYFFDRHIKDKIKYSISDVNYTDYNFIDGGMADPLWIQRDIISIDLCMPGSTKNNVKKQPDELLNWLTPKCGKDHAIWFYEMVLENSASVGIELQDYEDFYWWWNFNYCYACQHYKSLGYANLDGINQIDMDQYFTNVTPWYANTGYQQWSMANRSNGVKYQGTMKSYKKVAKDYIFSVDKNPWYRDYKTKTASPGFNNKNKILTIHNNGKFILG